MIIPVSTMMAERRRSRLARGRVASIHELPVSSLPRRLLAGYPEVYPRDAGALFEIPYQPLIILTYRYASI
jgi:hypothetical protein